MQQKNPLDSLGPSVCPSVCLSVHLSPKISVTTEPIGFYYSGNIFTGSVVVFGYFLGGLTTIGLLLKGLAIKGWVVCLVLLSATPWMDGYKKYNTARQPLLGKVHARKCSTLKLLTI